jgi:hypothetical protein
MYWDRDRRHQWEIQKHTAVRPVLNGKLGGINDEQHA